MALITKIKHQKNKERVNIYLDGKFGFGIDLINFVNLGLKVEQNLTNKEIEKLKFSAGHQLTLDKMINFALVRPRSKKELENWLYRKKVPDKMHGELFKKLTRLKLIDDEEFARWWVDQRIQFKSKSKRELQFELKCKGISREIIEKVIDESKINEEALVKRLLETKAYKWEKMNEHTRRKKITEFLARKGFGWETIKNFIGDFEN